MLAPTPGVQRHMRGPWECVCVRVKCVLALTRLGLLCSQLCFAVVKANVNPSTQSLFMSPPPFPSVCHDQCPTSSLHWCRAQQQLESQTLWGPCLVNWTFVFEWFGFWFGIVVCFLFSPNLTPGRVFCKSFWLCVCTALKGTVTCLEVELYETYHQ